MKIPCEDLDQVHLPDPVLNDLSKLEAENNSLREELNILKKQVAELVNKAK